MDINRLTMYAVNTHIRAIQPTQSEREEMPAHGGFQIADYSNEKSVFGFQTGPVTALTLPGLLTQFGALRGAVEYIIDGVVHKEWQYAFDSLLTNVLPGDPTVQRERKWLGTYEDTTQNLAVGVPNPGYLKKFTFEIPTADFGPDEGDNPRLLPNQDVADLASPTIAAFITAFQAIARSPYGGETRVLSMQGVGRNL